jgi:hypothetical protein
MAAVSSGRDSQPHEIRDGTGHTHTDDVTNALRHWLTLVSRAFVVTASAAAAVAVMLRHRHRDPAVDIELRNDVPVILLRNVRHHGHTPKRFVGRRSPDPARQCTLRHESRSASRSMFSSVSALDASPLPPATVPDAGISSANGRQAAAVALAVLAGFAVVATVAVLIAMFL